MASVLSQTYHSPPETLAGHYKTQPEDNTKPLGLSSSAAAALQTRMIFFGRSPPASSPISNTFTCTFAICCPSRSSGSTGMEFKRSKVAVGNRWSSSNTRMVLLSVHRLSKQNISTSISQSWKHLQHKGPCSMLYKGLGRKTTTFLSPQLVSSSIPANAPAFCQVTQCPVCVCLL